MPGLREAILASNAQDGIDEESEALLDLLLISFEQ
jgi:hypothetical protein